MAKTGANIAFRYESLQADEIRLCRMRCTENGSLELELQHFCLDSKIDSRIDNSLAILEQNRPSYTALSYTWGSEQPMRSVHINDGTFYIRQNLHRFLESASTETDIWFWIDQICIDQSNVCERSEQVLRMDRIYSNAGVVRVWLGLGDEQTIHAMKALAEFNVVVADAFQRTNGWMGKDKEMELEFEQRNVHVRRLLQDRPHWVSGLTELFNLPYWTRQWIVQELWLAKHLCLQCGSIKLTEMKGPPVKYHNDNHVFLASLADTITCLQVLTNRGNRAGKQLFASWQAPSLYLSLWEALRNFNGDCSDTRDKVYGVLGLVEPGERVVVDYTLTSEEVFWSTTEVMYTKSKFVPGLDVYGIDILSNLAGNMGLISLQKFGDSLIGRMCGSLSLEDISKFVERIYAKRNWQWPPATDVMDDRWTRDGY